MSFSRLLTHTTIQERPFLASSPSRALLAAMARRGRTTRPKATARLQQLFIRCNAVCQIAVTQ